MPLKQLINPTGGDQPSNQGQSSSPAPERESMSSSKPVMSGKNVLSNDVEIKGSLKFSQDLIIDGKIDGEVLSDGSLTVGENATVMGEIKTKSCTIFGKVQGNVTVTERCELKMNAVLEGDVSAGTLSIEEGATFMGQSSVGRKAVQSASSSSQKPQQPQGGGEQKKSA